MVQELKTRTHLFRAASTCYINHIRNFIRHAATRKDSLLKLGRLLFLSGLFNGCRGTVHALDPNKAPIININGRLIVIEKCRFEVYGPESKAI